MLEQETRRKSKKRLKIRKKRLVFMEFEQYFMHVFDIVEHCRTTCVLKLNCSNQRCEIAKANNQCCLVVFSEFFCL